jgi:tRNA dimethylallyltransferase
MIDIIEPDTDYDAALYARQATKTIHQLVAQGIIPIVVGGTGFYIKALLYGLFEAGTSDIAIRQQLKNEAEVNGANGLYERLQKCDPEAASRIHPNDGYRIIRALEVFLITGEPISKLHNNHQFKQQPFKAYKIGLTIDRKILYQRINHRVEEMIEAGLLDEVRGLLERGIPPDSKAMQAIGYRHMVNYLEHSMPWEECVALMQRDTRRYAKRQFTWLNKEPDLTWMEPAQIEMYKPQIETFLKAG